MTIANLPSIMGAVLIGIGLLLVLVQFFFRPSANSQPVFAGLVTIVIVGALLVGVGSFVAR